MDGFSYCRIAVWKNILALTIKKTEFRHSSIAVWKDQSSNKKKIFGLSHHRKGVWKNNLISMEKYGDMVVCENLKEIC